MYDEDDLQDYGDAGYDDDAIDEVLTVLRNKVSEDEAVDALEKTDWDVDAAIAILKKRVAAAAATAAKKQAAAAPAPKPAVPSPQPTKGKLPTAPPSGLSKLQALAQRKAQTQAESGEQPSKLSALSKLRKKEPSQTTQNGQEAPKLSALEKLRRRAGPKESPPNSQPGSRPGSKDSSPAPAGPSQEAAPQAAAPELSFAFEATSRPQPSRFGSLLAASLNLFRPSAVANTVTTNANMQSSFEKESPDDRVLNAQTGAFRKDKAPATKPAAPAAPVKKLPPTKSKDTLLAQLASLSVKPRISFVVIGHVDAGKSTLMGRLLLDSGAISQKVVDKHTRDSAKIGKSSFALAWVMDATTEERERGVTVDMGEAFFETENARFTVVDAPGHRDYVPNMIAGVAQADIAVLVVDSDTNAFESGFSLDGQTKEHAVLARSLGIETMIVAINKLDTQAWSEERFDDIRVQLTEFLGKTVGFDPSKLVFVPTSGINGDYVAKPSQAAAWYSGPTLVQALEKADTKQRDPSAPFRFIVSNAFQEEYQPYTTITGRVVSGALEKDDPIINVSESEQGGVVKQLDSDSAIAGDVIEFKTDLAATAVRAGDVLTSPESPLKPTTAFTARILLFDLKRPLLQGARLSFYMGRVNQSVKVTKIVASLDRQGNVIKKKPRHLTKGQNARVVISFDHPVVVAPFKESKDLGRFVLRFEGSTIGGGVVEDTNIESKEATPAATSDNS